MKIPLDHKIDLAELLKLFSPVSHYNPFAESEKSNYQLSRPGPGLYLI